MEYVIIFVVVGMIVGVVAVFLVAKFYVDTLPSIDQLPWDDLEWDSPDEDKKIQPLLGVVHPSKSDLL
jgi:hypothetical protein